MVSTHQQHKYYLSRKHQLVIIHFLRDNKRMQEGLEKGLRILSKLYITLLSNLIA